MRPVRPHQQQGYILISVILAIALISSIAFMLNQEGVINTHLVAGEAQSDEAHYVAEAGLNHAKWLLNTMDCSGYTDIPNTPFGQNSYSAAISPDNGSPVTVTATGQLASGVTQTIAFADTRVFAVTPTTVTLQPDATSGKDTYLRSDRANNNYGGATDIHAEQGFRNGLVEFDLSTLPADATITGAILELFLTNDGSNAVQVDVHRVSRSWVENGATWNRYDGTNNWSTAGGDYDAAAAASTIVPTGNNTWHQWDITTLVSDWLTNTSPNYGLMLRQIGARDRVQFASSENGTATRHPKLTISYLGECGTSGGGGGTIVTVPLSQDSYMRSNSINTNYGTAVTLLLGRSGIGNYRPIAQFDVSAITPLSVISSAVLRFYVNNVTGSTGADISIDVRPITQTWIETQVSWRRRITGVNWMPAQGGTYDPSVGTLVIPGGSPGVWIELDITALAQEWVDLVSPNNGVLLLSNETDPILTDLNSREDAVNQPQLVITYTPGP